MVLPPFCCLGGRLPFWLLILDRCHLSAGGSRLGGLPLVITWFLSPTGVTSRSPRGLRCHLAGRINQDFRLHGGVGHGMLVGDDQQLIEGLGLVAEESMLEEGASWHPAVKYSITCTSCMPSQELRSSVQRVR